ncbi:unnamed protein product [Rotaria sordida]|uniref:Uncharacterized protein n=1 Tax=Rotaria sordida TaxID=392033 RepID=A0A815E6B0_9BILA|nr:unnamed protein product [Rotaria sordida]CAF1583336.1 unnamed protein product [Rotaria sordida]
MYCVCCPCFYTRQQRKRAEKEARRKPAAADQSQRISRWSDSDYMTFNKTDQLTSATVVAQPSPTIAKFTLRKNVDRLNTECHVINEFRTRLERIVGYKRNSRANLLDE